jgi:hypothetical protein
MNDWLYTCTEEEYDDWCDSDEYTRISDMGERYYRSCAKSPNIPELSCQCTWPEGSKEEIAWSNGYRSWGN